MRLLRKHLHRLIFKLFVFSFLIAIWIIHTLRRVPIKISQKSDVNRECSATCERECSKMYYPGFSEPVDLVVTWVNGSDPSFINSLSRFNKSRNGYRNTAVKRFRDWGTLRYCLRSVEKYANWIRHVYIVTNGQVPSWLNLQNPRMSIVKHSEIFTNKSHLPCFNSRAIESHIHRIQGLSDQFLYMNDDFFFASKVDPMDFYSSETGFKVRFDAVKVPNCSKECKLSDINNGICDAECNSSICDWDGEDCKGDHTNTTRLSGLDSHDSFFGALMYTVYQYNKAFGYVYRMVPAHVPYIIDKALMNELQNRFPEGWERTSAHRVRDSYSFQYAFAYYHYLLRPQTHLCKEKGPVATMYRNYEDYTYYVTGDPRSLWKNLYYLLVHQHKKFICINDHMRYRDPWKEALNKVVIDIFFQELFPTPSIFEQQ